MHTKTRSLPHGRKLTTEQNSCTGQYTSYPGNRLGR